VFRSLLKKRRACVSDVALENGISEVSATQCLRALNSRGLLRVSRVSRWVEYRIGHDPLVSGTEELVEALCTQLRGKGDVIDRTFKDVTAFTHPRRILIVGVLTRHKRLWFSELRALTGISTPALSKHLAKLRRRGLVDADGDRYCCCKPRGSVMKTLVGLVCQ